MLVSASCRFLNYKVVLQLDETYSFLTSKGVASALLFHLDAAKLPRLRFVCLLTFDEIFDHDGNNEDHRRPEQ